MFCRFTLILVAILACNAQAFAPSPKGWRGFKSLRTSQKMNQKQEPDEVVRSVFGKDLAFDDKTGRFFETKYSGEEVKGDPAGKGIFDIFRKPEGTFFDELKKTDSSEKNTENAFSLPFFGSTPAVSPTESPEFSLSIPFLDDKPRKSTGATQNQQTNLPSFFDNLFMPKEAEPEELVPVYDKVTISPDFRAAAAFLVPGLLLDQIPYLQLTLGPIATLLGILFLVQSFRIRFVFTEDNEFQLVNVNPLTGETEYSGENPVVGGANEWACDKIANYDFFPPIGSSPIGPILVYFKETQTDPSFWNEGPGKVANDPSKVASGEAVAGQVHFFPAICNAEEINEEFAYRGCGKVKN